MNYFFFFFFSVVCYSHTSTRGGVRTTRAPRPWSCYAFAWFHCCTERVFLYIFGLGILTAGKEPQVSFCLLLKACNFFQLYLFLVLVINSEITFLLSLTPNFPFYETFSKYLTELGNIKWMIFHPKN